MGELYPRHERRTKNPAETTGNRYKIEFLMSRTQKLKGLSAASLRLKTLNDNPYLNNTGKYVLFNQRRKRQIPLYSDSDQLTENSNVDDEPYDKEYDDKLFVVRTAVRDMPEPCSKLLNLVVYQKKSHHEVAQIMNYANEDTVKAQRWRCMKKLKEVVATRLKIAGYEE